MPTTRYGSHGFVGLVHAMILAGFVNASAIEFVVSPSSVVLDRLESSQQLLVSLSQADRATIDVSRAVSYEIAQPEIACIDRLYRDRTGEDGNLEAKVKRIEEFDAIIPRVLELNPTVTIVTGDHSTPSFLRNHSWHPVPTLLVADCRRADGLTTFGENTCIRGGLGHFEAKHLMTLALANAGRVSKYGA